MLAGMRVVSKLLALLLAACLWLPSLHCCFRPPRPPAAGAALVERQIALWLAHAPRSNLLATNPEWALMHRMFDVLAFANVALERPAERARALQAIDTIVDDVLAIEAARGQYHYLLPYARAGRFHDPAGRSLFVDGEIALMLVTRQLVAPDPARRAERHERVARVVAQLEHAPALLAESYPDEGWTFCNVVALVAIRLSDAESGEDHRDLVHRWVASARAHLTEPTTGLFASSFTFHGRPQEGPEGSTIWLVASFLQLLDPALAADQYARACRELGHQALGFAWASEWPATLRHHDDVDSGPTIPIVGANAGSSGLALVAAGAFGDAPFLAGLLTSLEFAGFPVDGRDGRHYAAGNDLADAVAAYALVQGPLWRHARAAGVTP
jgi:hypothetical protein